MPNPLQTPQVFCPPPGGNTEGVELADQAAVLNIVGCSEVSNQAAHRLTGVNHKVVERIKRSWLIVLKKQVHSVQDRMRIGGNCAIVEADEAAVRKSYINKSKVEWDIVVGAKIRGQRRSLVLKTRESSKCIVKVEKAKGRPGRSAPCPYTKVEFKRLHTKFWEKDTVTMVDGAKAYPAVLQPLGEAMAAVNHSCTKGRRPVYAKRTKVKLGKKDVDVVAGTCSMDGLWGHLKLRLRNVKAKSQALRLAKIHFQLLHWTRDEDRWPLMGHIIN